jgi:hypothetical protein
VINSRVFPTTVLNSRNTLYKRLYEQTRNKYTVRKIFHASHQNRKFFFSNSLVNLPRQAKKINIEDLSEKNCLSVSIFNSNVLKISLHTFFRLRLTQQTHEI